MLVRVAVGNFVYIILYTPRAVSELPAGPVLEVLGGVPNKELITVYSANR